MFKVRDSSPALTDNIYSVLFKTHRTPMDKPYSWNTWLIMVPSDTEESVKELNIHKQREYLYQF